MFVVLVSTAVACWLCTQSIGRRCSRSRPRPESAAGQEEKRKGTRTVLFPPPHDAVAARFSRLGVEALDLSTPGWIANALQTRSITRFDSCRAFPVSNHSSISPVDSSFAAVRPLQQSTQRGQDCAWRAYARRFKLTQAMAAMENSRLKLSYFDARGVAETTRYMLAVTKTPSRGLHRLYLRHSRRFQLQHVQRPEFDAAKAAGKSTRTSAACRCSRSTARCSASRRRSSASSPSASA